MHCPFCTHQETKVIDSRLAAEGQQVRRRRECLHCGERFTTFETAELVMPRVVKSDAMREPFDEAKLRAGRSPGPRDAPLGPIICSARGLNTRLGRSPSVGAALTPALKKCLGLSSSPSRGFQAL